MAEGVGSTGDHGLVAQHQALREGCALLEESGVSPVTLSGEDRVRFLNGLVTCDVRRLAPGQGAYGFFTDAKGHILADVVVRALPDRLFLELATAQRESLVEHLETYVVADRVEIHRVEDHLGVTVAGARSAEPWMRLLQERALSPEPWGHLEAELSGQPLLVAADRRLGVPAWTAWTPAANASELRTALLAVAGPRLARAIAPSALETVRVEAGVPWFGRDFGPQNLPQETGLEEAVSYDKGCYLGQEVIARLHYRGQVARQLRRLRFDGLERPPLGVGLLDETREVGRVSSAVASPATGRITGLAMVQRRAIAAGTRLDCVGGGVAEVLGEPVGFGCRSDRE